MTRLHKSLCWAGAILFNALGNVYGLIDDRTAQTLFIVLPVIAVMSLRDRSCLQLGAKA